MPKEASNVSLWGSNGLPMNAISLVLPMAHMNFAIAAPAHDGNGALDGAIIGAVRTARANIFGCLCSIMLPTAPPIEWA